MSSTTPNYPLLDSIETPEQLRQLNIKQLPQLCEDVRNYLIHTIADAGGHFAAGLGAIELTVALHYVFNTPNDRLIWDVGHQTYPHKILTGRKARLSTIRKFGGLSPFPKRNESHYDHFGVGHSSTSIGAAVGMALAFKQQGMQNKAIAIIGDGGMSAGMAYEAMNHLGGIQSDVLIILNDNEMSISPNVGAMSNYLARIISSKLYTSVKRKSRKLLNPIPPLQEFAHRTKEHIKGMIIPGTFFEELNISYFGPVDGHKVIQLVETLQNLKNMQHPRLLHLVTCKGKGYEQAEDDPVGYHAVSQFDPHIGVSSKTAKELAPSYSKIFSDWICDMAEKDARLVAITPAMREGSGLIEFEKRFPHRYFDVAIAEQHAVTLAAGLACEGMKPIVAIYSTFLQRAYDQLIHDVALQNLPIVFAIDRAGLVGPDGQTHAGSFDLNYTLCIPNLTVMVPSNGEECRKMLTTAFMHSAPSTVRYPRGNAKEPLPIRGELEPIAIGKAIERRRGQDIALLGFGVTNAEEAAEQLNATFVDMRFVKPLDTVMLEKIAATHSYLITVEDGAIAGGAGSTVGAHLSKCGLPRHILNIGIPDYFQNHGSREELLEEIGLDVTGIVQQVKQFTSSDKA